MAQRKKGSVEEQRARQRELIELKRKKQEFEENPDQFSHEGPKEAEVLHGRKRWQNFWYYSRKTVVFILFIAILFVFGVTQCVTKKKYDVTIVLYMKQYVESTVIWNLQTVAEKYCQDYNGDGEVNVLVVDCAVPENERLTNAEKGNALAGQFVNSEAILYIVDNGAYDDLYNSFGSDFLYYGMRLPDKDGSALQLNGTSFDAAFDSVLENYTENFDYYILRRNIKGDTLIAGKSGVKDHVKHAEELIRNIIADPLLGTDHDDSSLPQTNKVN